jgi:hypothetical protein
MGDSKKKDSIFYHDVLNQIHSLNLFFEQKISSSQSIGIDEIKMLSDEITVLEKLLKRHFRPEQQMIGDKNPGEPIIKCSELIKTLCSSYFSESCELNIEGLEVFELKYTIDFSSFHRVITNIIKNIAESGATKVELFFMIDKGFLKIGCQNNFSPEKSNKSGPNRGFGLSSIQTLVKHLGGSYHSFVEGDNWHTAIEFPIFSQEVLQLVA